MLYIYIYYLNKTSCVKSLFKKIRFPPFENKFSRYRKRYIGKCFIASTEDIIYLLYIFFSQYTQVKEIRQATSTTTTSPTMHCCD